jgi:DNA topoisomerase I
VAVARLRRVDCSGPGITRRRRGRGFEFLDENGNRVEDPGVLERIRELVIPPAWTDVWICPYPHGHIQAVGSDAAGRRQYRYHDRWRERRDQQKFDEMLDFARALPRLRKVATKHLSLDGLPRERVLGGAVRLLDRGFFRIGGEDYAESNGTYGLATMQKHHATLGDDGVVTFDYEAKGGTQHVQSIVDAEVYELVRDLKRRRSGGDELLAYRNGRRWVDVKSPDINAYIKEHTGADFSAKDFRTWNATVLAAVGLAVSGRAAGSASARKRAITRAAKEVAHYLGNTPAVCRASYIDPRVFDRYRDGVTIGGAIDALGEEDALGGPSSQSPVEAAVLDLLEERESSPVLERVA